MDHRFLSLAALEAEKHVGATSPNPPVGACVEREGVVLGLGAHQKAGFAHAELNALKAAAEKHGSEALKGSTIHVTLEPCNHFGRTPPCSHAILEAGIKRVVYAAKDPNQNVAGGGAEFLKNQGIEVIGPVADKACERLNAPFVKKMRTGLPWVVMKQAYRSDSETSPTMLPPAGNPRSTFSSQSSLKLAHELRRSCDAIITGSGTIVKDLPQFNVRLVSDHAGKNRVVAVITRASDRIPLEWIELQSRLGQEVLFFSSPLDALKSLGKRGALRVLVEGGPKLGKLFEEENLWDERLRIHCEPGLEDRIEWERR